jgi:hypothetical protein
MTTHELKCWPEPFSAILDGSKRFELRNNDRDFAVGDVLVLREWVPGEPAFGHLTGHFARAVVTYILPGGRFGLPPDLCVMSIAPEQTP